MPIQFFKEPVPVEPWNGTWIANTVHRCLQYRHLSAPKLEDPVTGQRFFIYYIFIKKCRYEIKNPNKALPLTIINSHSNNINILKVDKLSTFLHNQSKYIKKFK